MKRAATPPSGPSRSPSRGPSRGTSRGTSRGPSRGQVGLLEGSACSSSGSATCCLHSCRP
ncbi:hypothetical protein EYF80_067687 [Liparis tanakae]|uniref:Uncharacterized protein n=1 Tax=Liparis tanakae TaxID=230148 RepID=A0A4Z2E0E0_9TELE|nr:hypothetical protein EYF80_067687 [Liparis tanakae]